MEKGSESAFKLMNQDFVRLDRLDGTNFMRWQDKMKFLLTTMKVSYVLDENLAAIPPPTENDTEALK